MFNLFIAAIWLQQYGIVVCFINLSIPVFKEYYFKLFIKIVCPYHEQSCNKIAIEQLNNILEKLAG